MAKRRGGGSRLALWDRVVRWISQPEPRRRRLFVREILISGDVRRYVRGSSCTEQDRLAFAELLLRLDGNPLASEPLLPADPTHPYPPGMRWAQFGPHRVIFQFDPGHDRLRMIVCEEQ